MSQINTNVSSLLAQRVLGQNNNTLTKSLERLSTGLRINRGADDPAGLIASEKLRSEKTAISSAIGNAERADQVINVAEGGLQEINSQLIELQSLIGQSANDAGLSVEEKEANQLQIDSILQTIDSIASQTTFGGTKLLNGNLDFQITGQATTIADFEVNAAKIENGGTRAVNVIVTASAQHAGVFVSAGAAALDTGGATSSFVIEIAGTKGSREFTFASGTSLTSVASAVNTFKSVTGISAAVSGTGVVLKSTEFGSDEFVSVDIINDGSQAGAVHTLSTTSENTAVVAGATAFSAVTNAIRDEGQDVSATINGISATSRGTTAQINTDFLDVSIELTTGGAQAAGTINAFTIEGGGAKFNIGPNVDIGNQVTIGVGNVAARKLGSVSTGFLDKLGSGKSSNVVDGDVEAAQKIVNSSIDQVSKLRGRLGAFQKNVLGSTIRSLGVALENTSAAESSIRDTDFASETAELTRSQILVNAATNVLAIANNQPQNVLSLL